MKVFAFPMTPANYTLDAIEHVYKPMGIGYAFVYGSSEASDKGCHGALVLEKISGWYRRLFTIYCILKGNDIFIVNSYTDKISLAIILLNLIWFKKPMGISSDTQLKIPCAALRRWGKRLLLGYIFSRKYIYGLPGGTKSHFDLFRHYGMDDDRIVVLPMMVDNSKYRRVEISAPNRMFRFAYVGRLVPCKQVDKIIRAFKAFLTKYRNAELHIIGDGELRDTLELEALGVPVIWHGSLFGADLIVELHKMHCLILFSSSESWGLVVNEALAAGIPCIVSDAVGARYDLIEGDCPSGLVVPANDEDGLMRAMAHLALDGKLWRQMSRNALMRMAQWDYPQYQAMLNNFLRKTGGIANAYQA